MLCISRQIPRVFRGMYPILDFRRNFRHGAALQAPIRPVNLEFRGHAHFFPCGGCVPLPRAGIVGKQSRIKQQSRKDFLKF
jgi:hypothetical protein